MTGKWKVETVETFLLTYDLWYACSKARQRVLLNDKNKHLFGCEKKYLITTVSMLFKI